MLDNMSIDTDQQQQEAASPQVVVARSSSRYAVRVEQDYAPCAASPATDAQCVLEAFLRRAGGGAARSPKISLSKPCRLAVS